VQGGMGGASQKAECVSCIYIGDMVTTLQKTTLIPGGSDALVYCTISGGVGTLVPLTSKDVSILLFPYHNFMNLCRL
jgi:splicing factor 3B subunit 3